MANKQRLIDADALRADAITRSGGTEFAFDNCYPFWQFSQAIAQAPTIEAAPVVNGYWVDHYICSNCGKRSTAGLDADVWTCYEPPFCPNCGAKMDGGVSDG